MSSEKICTCGTIDVTQDADGGIRRTIPGPRDDNCDFHGRCSTMFSEAGWDKPRRCYWQKNHPGKCDPNPPPLPDQISPAMVEAIRRPKNPYRRTHSWCKRTCPRQRTHMMKDCECGGARAEFDHFRRERERMKRDGH